MSAQALLLCGEESVLYELAPMLLELGIDFRRCRGPRQAREALRQRRFDPIILDCDVEGASELLGEVRQYSASRDSIVLALADASKPLKELFRSGANLIVRKPIATEAAERTLRTARGLVMRMRRHFVRQAIPQLAYVNVEGMESAPLMLDLGEGGISVQALEALEPERVLRLRFDLPDTSATIEATGQIVWADASGRAGIRFVRLPESARKPLRQWLAPGAGALRRLGYFQLEDERGKVTAPIRVAGSVEKVLALVVDLTFVGGSVALFGTLVFALAGILPVAKTYLAWGTALGALHAVIYRRFIFARPRATPGMILSQQLTDAYVDFAYRRRLAGWSPVVVSGQ